MQSLKTTLATAFIFTMTSVSNSVPILGGLGPYGAGLGSVGGIGGLGGWGCWIPFAAGGYGASNYLSNLGFANVNAISAGHNLQAVRQNDYLNAISANQGFANTAANRVGATGIIA